MIEYARLWDRQAAFSNRVFGKDRGPVGPLNHLLRELDELEHAKPEDRPFECADVLILAIDAARRAGFGVTATRNDGPYPRATISDLENLTRAAISAAERGEFRVLTYATLVAHAFDVAEANDIWHDELIVLAFAKTLINERRQWGKPDAEGVCEHVRTEVVKDLYAQGAAAGV